MPETIYITTPCLNARETIDRTVLSVVTQAGDFRIRYHIQDQGSTDGTLERLKWWQRRLNAKGFPLSCEGLTFSFASQEETTRYAALCQGLAHMNAPANAFMTWLTPGDILTTGALAFITNVDIQFTPQQVSWVTGNSALLRADVPVEQPFASFPKAAIQAGLCDGTHWSSLQQAGTFFRKWMWAAIDTQKHIAPMTAAGDWNLWRLFAGKASVMQATFSLAACRVTDGQDPESLQKSRTAEMQALLSEDARQKGLKAMAQPKADVRCRILQGQEKDPGLVVMEKGVNAQVAAQKRKLLGGDAPKLPANDKKPRVHAKGKLPDPADDVPLHSFTSFENNIAAYDKDWQFPAITEQQAFHQMRDAASVPDGVTYVAYPWANLIDKLQTHAPDARWHTKKFQEFIDQLPKGTVRVTTCQHIKMREFLHLFEQAGISHIFWTHATQQEAAEQETAGFAIHPFPLYPVQIPDADSIMPITERPYLFSFIGAKSNKYYLTRAREWIIDLLPDHPKGLIIGRDNWHYNKVVYEHQIKPGAKGGNAADLVDKSASEQFKISMVQSVFSLCPAGTGPNSIRLWESFGAGAIPVILADTYAPPGDPALWEAGAVFCKEDPESIKALPARLEEIASDPNKLDAMRKVGTQLWLLYGPDSFVYDIQKLMLTLAQAPGGTASNGPAVTPCFRTVLAQKMDQKDSIQEQDAQLLLRVCSSDLLLEGRAILPSLQDDSSLLGQMLEQAQDMLPEHNSTLAHFNSVVAHVETQENRSRFAAPSVATSGGIKLSFFGKHANRTPLSYPVFQQVLGNRIQIETDPAKADVVMTGYNIDLRENASTFAALAKDSPDTKIMVISEEPLWDSLWSGGFAATGRKVKCDNTDVSYTFLNHSNSGIYDFDQIPYFLLTADDLLARYGVLIKRNCQLSPKALLAQWQKAPISAAFVAEKREGDKYAKSFPEHALYGLSSYRSDVAAQTAGKDVHREGKGWHSDKPRQDLPDWHLDKLAALNGRVRVMSSFENTHQKNYISEKILDAFVVGGIPTYYADENHSIHKLVPAGCVINTFGKSAAEAAQMISGVAPDMAMAEVWIDTAQKLQSRLTDHTAVLAERKRVAEAIMQAIETA
ncbi:MAG: hypothetical protein GY892_12665 [Shimia sp.]|nr:hypothetical protein [Shimia sp.]